jgi:hypothetical protein
LIVLEIYLAHVPQAEWHLMHGRVGDSPSLVLVCMLITKLEQQQQLVMVKKWLELRLSFGCRIDASRKISSKACEEALPEL